jgi:acyl-CoA dehydrogenase
MFDLRPSPRVLDTKAALELFLDEAVYPHEEELRRKGTASPELELFQPPIVKELQNEARRRGLWNCLVRGEPWGTDLGYREAATLAELTGKSWLLPRAINWQGPDHGNIELLIDYGTQEQQERWLPGLLESDYGSCFAMTEPAVASSDASNISTVIERDGDDYVINGRKWWISCGDQDRVRLAIVVGRTDDGAGSHGNHSIVLVPMDTPGVSVARSLSVFNYHSAAGELVFDNVRVPVSNLLGQEGRGFAIAQERLAPARIYHAMRMVGHAERALDLMAERANERTVFGKSIGEHGMAQQQIALSRIEINAVRLLVLDAAAQVDELGARAAMNAISQVKIAAPDMAAKVIDRAIQVHGGAGLSNDFPMAWMYAMARTVRIADGPDEVHLRTIARNELKATARRVEQNGPSGGISRSIY